MSKIAISIKHSQDDTPSPRSPDVLISHHLRKGKQTGPDTSLHV